MQFNIIYHNIIVIRSTTHPVDKLDGIPAAPRLISAGVGFVWDALIREERVTGGVVVGM